MNDLSGLEGEWHERYQRHDAPTGEWICDTTRVEVTGPGKLSFKSFDNPVGESYAAEGELHGEREVVGVWHETQAGAMAEGSFHLYIDPFGKKLYGICTGPGGQGQAVYSGWVLARKEEDLDASQRDLASAMLVCGSAPVTGNKNVFIVHGHDEAKKLELKGFLSELGLRPIILHEQDDMGGTVIEKFEHYAPRCGFAFVLMTPDDKLRTRDSTEAKWRARQNVIMELGWFMARLGRRRVVLLCKGKPEIPSDILGVVQLEFDKSVLEVAHFIRTRLKGAGLID
jgi:predicted nucleotide-binding protein